MTDLLSHRHDGDVFSEEDHSLHAVEERHPVQFSVGQLQKLVKPVLSAHTNIQPRHVGFAAARRDLPTSSTAYYDDSDVTTSEARFFRCRAATSTGCPSQTPPTTHMGNNPGSPDERLMAWPLSHSRPGQIHITKSYLKQNLWIRSKQNTYYRQCAHPVLPNQWCQSTGRQKSTPKTRLQI